jgi:hypothetical protein
MVSLFEMKVGDMTMIQFILILLVVQLLLGLVLGLVMALLQPLLGKKK